MVVISKENFSALPGACIASSAADGLVARANDLPVYLTKADSGLQHARGDERA
jgi:hypothetical protein